jgi:hypothetical protein
MPQMHEGFAPLQPPMQIHEDSAAFGGSLEDF